MKDNLNINRIWDELQGRKTFEIMAYLSYLEKEYPITFKKLGEKYPTMGIIKIKK